jgi:hypothetical protein
VGHSLGSVMCFEYLSRAPHPAVKAFVSLGSPLDREPVKSQALQRTGGIRELNIPWLNIWGDADLICCWQPERSGEMNDFYPTEQIRLPKQLHDFEGYLPAVPSAWLKAKEL